MNANNYKNVALTSRFGDTDVPMAYGEMRVDFPVDHKMLAIVDRVQKALKNS